MIPHHIGMACHDIEVTARFYVDLGYKQGETVYDSLQNVKICFLEYTGGGAANGGSYPIIELVSPYDDKSPVNKYLSKNGVGPYHICYMVGDIERSILELRKKQFIAVSHPVPAVAFGGRKVCFLFNKAVGLIELVEYA